MPAARDALAPSPLGLGSAMRGATRVPTLVALLLVACSDPGSRPEPGAGGEGGSPAIGTGGAGAGAPSSGGPGAGAMTGGAVSASGGSGDTGGSPAGAGGSEAAACLENPRFTYVDDLLAAGVELWNLAVVSCKRAEESCELNPTPGITFVFCSCLNDNGLNMTQCPNTNRTFLDCTGATERSASDFQCLSGVVVPNRDGPCWTELMAFSGCSEEGGGG